MSACPKGIIPNTICVVGVFVYHESLPGEEAVAVRSS